MGITKQYLKFVAAGNPFGIIASQNGEIVFLDLDDQKGKLVACSSCENIIIWDTKTGEKLQTLTGAESDGTCLASSSSMLASGFNDGSIRIYDLTSSELKSTLNGHSSAVNCLCYDFDGMRLASGGKDCEIVVWDTVNEAGLYRLKGHKHVVTQLQFIPEKEILISSSRDTYIKFWDLNTQHCFKTLTGHRTEIWDFVLIESKNWLITGSSDSELRVWKVTDGKGDESTTVDHDEADSNEDDGETNDESGISVIKVGSILRKSTTPVRSLSIDEGGRYLVCHGKDLLVETFKMKTQAEAELTARKRNKKEKKRDRKQVENPEPDDHPILTTFQDEFESLAPFKPSAKIKSSSVYCKSNDDVSIVALLDSNKIEMYRKAKLSQAFEPISSIYYEGHRTDVRTISFNSDGYFILSASADAVKVWSRASKKCLASITEPDCGYALCSLFAPGDRIALVGTKEGNIHIYDISSCCRQEVVQASDKPIWSMDLYPDKKGIVTGSEDKSVKFWDFDMVTGEDGKRRMTIVHRRTLEMDESILCVKISPNFKFLAVSLTDSTVKIFFFDTLKFFLNLYGHKFPVLTMDISSDSTIIATGSSDKNIKLWGMDFGDCHKSIFAHEDAITQLQFVPNTHQLFSCSKDKTIKQWDADRFEKILTLTGHQSEIWCMTVAPNGKFVVSASHDKSLRIWEKTSEPLVLQEEEEDERERLFEQNLLKESPIVAGESATSETGFASKKTGQGLRATELLLEAIDLNIEEKERKSHVSRSLDPPNPLLAKFNTTSEDRFVLETLRSIKSSQLEEALLSLPFNYVISLLEILSILLSKHWEVELTNRCITFLTRYAHCFLTYLFFYFAASYLAPYSCFFFILSLPLTHPLNKFSSGPNLICTLHSPLFFI